MAEIALSFMPAMMLAYLAGRKNNTRRVVKESTLARYAQHPASLGHEDDLGFVWAEYALEDDAVMDSGAVEYARFLRSLCPYGRKGDRLLIKEGTYQGSDSLAYYQADRKPVIVAGGEHARWLKADGEPYKRGSLNTRFMPRDWARFRPEIIEEPFPQRVADISEADAIAEGIWQQLHDPDPGWGWLFGGPCYASATLAFRALWDSINAERGHGWDANDWVWAIKFERYGEGA